MLTLKRPFDEVIFYDDASTDNTCELLSAKGFKVIKGAVNQGPGFARNKLAESTTCDWFHFHDIDDRLDPDYLVKTSLIAESKDADVVLCNVNWYDAQSQTLLFSWVYSNEGIRNNPLAYTIANPIGGINGLYRSAKFMASGGFNTQIKIWEDADMHVRLAGNNARFYVIEEVLSYAYRYSNSASNNYTQGWLNRLLLLQSYYQQFTNLQIRDTIGKQAQTAASHLVILHQYKAAQSALKLSEKCGVKVPDKNSSSWNLIKLLLPAFVRVQLRLVQLKYAFRKHNG